MTICGSTVAAKHERGEDEMDLSRQDRQRREEEAAEVARPCPCCGGAVQLQERTGVSFGWRVACIAARCAVQTPWVRLPVTAVYIWNKRAATRPHA